MSFNKTTAIQVAGEIVGALGMSLAALFMKVYWRKREVKILATDVLLASMVVSDIFTCAMTMAGMFALMAGPANCGPSAFFLTAGIVTYSIHSVMIPAVFSFHLTREHVMTLKAARIAAGVIWGMAFTLSGAFLGASGAMVAPGGVFCLPDIVQTDENDDSRMGALVLLGLVLLSTVPLQCVLHFMIYYHAKHTFTSRDENFDNAGEEDAPDFSGAQPKSPSQKESKNLFVRVTKPETRVSDLSPEDIQRRANHRKVLFRIALRSFAYLSLSMFRLISFFVAQAGDSVATMSQFMLAIMLSPSLTVLVYGVGNPEYRRGILFCGRLRRGSDSGSSHSSSGSKAQVSVVVNAEVANVGSDNVTFLEDGLRIVIDKATRVPTLEGLTMLNLLSYSIGVEYALKFDKEHKLQCEENINFCILVRQYKELAADSSDRRAPWDHGKRIVREYMSGQVYKANIEAKLCAGIKEYFAPSFRNVTGKEFDAALKEIYKMLDDNFGFMGKFRKSHYNTDLARYLANREKERKTDVRTMAIKDLRHM